jgi:hypothetical protein
LSIVGRAADVYRLGSPQVRRLSNQLFFEEVRISVDEDGEQIMAPVAREPWSILLARSFAERIGRDTTNLHPVSSGGGSKDDAFVPPARPTERSRSPATAPPRPTAGL